MQLIELQWYVYVANYKLISKCNIFLLMYCDSQNDSTALMASQPTDICHTFFFRFLNSNII